MGLTRTIRRQVPSFALYGEISSKSDRTDALHVEDIQCRSRKYLWRIARHRHTGQCQCVYVMTGAVVTDLEESKTTVEAPAAIIVPAGAVHAFTFRAESQGYVLTVDLARLLSGAAASHHCAIAEMFSIPRTVDLSRDPPLAARIGRLFESLLEAFRQPDAPKSPLGGWLACSILWVLASNSVTVPGGTPGRHDLERLSRFRQLVESHYLQHWTVKRYARQLALSASSLNRLCQALTGATASDLIQERMALEARRRLIYVAGSVAAIAAELGFRDPAYFSRFFRKHSGMSPSLFRRRAGG